MSHKRQGSATLEALFLGQSRLREGKKYVSPVAGARVEDLASPLMHQRVLIDSVVISLDAADDFGAIKLIDHPDSNMNAPVLATVIACAVDVAGLTTNQVNAVNFAIGREATTSVDFTAPANADGLIPLTAGTGAGASGSFFGLATLSFIGSTDGGIWVNVASPVTSGTGTVTLSSGRLDIWYLDVGGQLPS